MPDPRGSPDFSPLRLAAEAMGTRFEIVLAAEPDRADDGARLRAAGEAALDEIRFWHARLSAFDRASFISHLAEHAPRGPVECDDEIFALLSLCRDVWRGSGGAFDPALAGLLRAAGLRDMPRNPEGLHDLAADGGFQHVRLDDAARTVAFDRPGLGLDLGGIGKGFALDRAAAVLREAGVSCALLHGGTSSVLALGCPPNPPCGAGDAAHDAGAAGWRIALADPSRPGAPGPVVTLRDAALGVSAPHGRVVHGPDGASHGHILDPRTGESARRADLAAVVAPGAALADAWSTALLVLGERPEAMPDSCTTIIAPSGSPRRWLVRGGAPVTLPAG